MARDDDTSGAFQGFDALGAEPDGLLDHRIGKFGQLVVAKQGNELFLVFCPRDVPLSNEALSGVMSRIDLTEPLTLKGIYTQAMLACLAFVPQPRHIYMMGAGGGRVPTVLHRFLPDVIIEGSEIDADVLEISRRFFGFEDGPRLRIACTDGLADLQTKPEARYDHIYLDCFDADGCVPQTLSTETFFGMCAEKLVRGGAICVNLVDRDPNFAMQRNGFLRVFSDVWRFEFEGTHVLFGRKADDHPARSDKDMLLRRVADLMARHPFGYDLGAHVAALTPVER